MFSEHAQRWSLRSLSWVPSRRLIDTRLLDESSAKAFVLKHHYSASYPAARLRVGLFERGLLVGVAVFSEPANVNTITRWTSRPRHEGVELGRFVLLDRVGFNAESFFFARARRLLRAHKPDVRFILAYSDPVERTSLSGERVFPGHVGQIYQATNASYLGRASARTHLLDDDGRVVSPRALSKIVSGVRSHEYARSMLERVSATSQAPGESAKDWVTRAKRHLRRLRHPGNHVYVWGVTRRDQAPDSLSFPRAPDPTQLGLC